MEPNDIKQSYMEETTFDGQKLENIDGNSALENNKNDSASNQGSSGVKNVQMGRKLSKIEEEYLIRSENFDRDEENPMYNETDPSWYDSR